MKRHAHFLRSRVKGLIQPQRRGAGFTLLEVFLVIVAIGLLAVIIVVAMHSAK